MRYFSHANLTPSTKKVKHFPCVPFPPAQKCGMSEFKIESKIKIPELNIRGCVPRFPFGKMKVGDSIFVPLEASANPASAASNYGSRHKLKFASRKEGNGVRIWRTE